MIITGVYSITGGSGASTTAVYLSRLLGMIDKRVLVVDLNPLNEAARLLSPLVKSKLSNIVKDKDIDFSQYISETNFKNISIITSYGVNIFTQDNINQQVSQPDFFQNLAEYCQNKYDHVLIDNSAMYSLGVTNSIKVCHKVIGLINAQSNGINKIVPFLEMVAQARIGKPLNFIKILLNNFDINNISHRFVANKYKKNLGKSLKFPVVINQFKYVKKDNKVMQKIPVKAYNIIATIINKKY